MMRTPDLLLKAFEKQEEFVGEVYIDGELRTEGVRCRCTFNPLDARALEATIHSDQSLHLDWGERPSRVVVRSDPDLRYTRLQIEGRLKKSTLSFGSRADEARIKVQQIFRFNKQEMDLREEGAAKIYSNWYFPPLTEVGGAFKAEKRPDRGLVVGWSASSIDNWEEGEWESQQRSFELGNRTFGARPNFSHETVETHDGEAYLAAPRLHVHGELEVGEAPVLFSDAIEHMKGGDEIIEPLVLALRFVAAKRLGSSYQVQNSYDPETRIRTRLRRYVWVANRETKGVWRSPRFQLHWKLITDIAQAIQERAEDKREFNLTRRAIRRYLEALEAPYFEMQLVAMHSALTLLVTERDDDVEPDEDLPDFGGRLLTPLKRFLTAKEVPWRDLVPEDESKGLFDFNHLRNAYLKDLEHNVDSIEPFEIARKLFERVLLADLGLQWGDYTFLQDW